MSKVPAGTLEILYRPSRPVAAPAAELTMELVPGVTIKIVAAGSGSPVDPSVALGVLAAGVPMSKIGHHQPPHTKGSLGPTGANVVFQEPQPFGARGELAAVVIKLGEIGRGGPARDLPPGRTMQVGQDQFR